MKVMKEQRIGLMSERIDALEKRLLEQNKVVADLIDVVQKLVEGRL